MHRRHKRIKKKYRGKFLSAFALGWRHVETRETAAATTAATEPEATHVRAQTWTF